MTFLNLPTPILGEVSAITITSNDLERSFEFYAKFGFSEVMRMDLPFPWIQISDGALLMMLRKDDTPYIALTYYVNDIEKSAAVIEDAGLSFAGKPNESDFVKKYLLKTPEEFNVSLINIVEGFTQPAGPTMLAVPQQGLRQTREIRQ